MIERVFFSNRRRMSQQKLESFHPRVIIVDHFDQLINRIDIRTETFLENRIFPQETRQDLNEIRERQIEKIK